MAKQMEEYGVGWTIELLYTFWNVGVSCDLDFRTLGKEKKKNSFSQLVIKKKKHNIIDNVFLTGS